MIEILGNPKDNSVTVMNNIQEKFQVDESSGIGLRNLSERYQLLGQEAVKVSHDQLNFYVTLKVIENESGDHRR